MAKKTEETKKEEVKKDVYYQAVGRRREATARIRLYLATIDRVKIGDKEHERGKIVVNDRPIDAYFPGEVSKKKYLEPLRTTNNLDRFVVSAKIEGGGLSGQLDAFVHGVSRALLVIDSNQYRATLKKHGFLTRDPRAKQRRKAGFAQKSRARKQSPKR
ncbi:30S ribosomal protein S9 [Candidatus Microgenomates bacterium]|nr:MAG: 30S ribosomal protein S9 [Candidatus Microgenomates bacterium]